MSRLRIIVLGYIVRGPLGGLVWHHLQYVVGLARLGHDVYFLEDSGDTAWCCYDPSRDLNDTDPSYGLGFASQAFGLVGMSERWAYHNAHTGKWMGPASSRVPEILRVADILLNLSGANPIRPWLQHIPVRVMIDTDPAFNQVRNLTDPVRRREADLHTAHFTYAENINRGASIPTDGFPWRPTRQPVVLEAWPVLPGPPEGMLTTVMQWDGYATREYGGQHFGMKSESFTPYLDLPQRVGSVFEVIIGGDQPRSLLTRHGWNVRSPHRTIPDPQSYQRFVQQSKAEFTVAKSGFVTTRSGWFSDRSSAYLASGRPVITQDTGYAGLFPTGEGLLVFSSPEEAVAAIAEVNSRYEQHCRAARGIVEEYFDARKILNELLDQSFATDWGDSSMDQDLEPGNGQSTPPDGDLP